MSILRKRKVKYIVLFLAPIIFLSSSIFLIVLIHNVHILTYTKTSLLQTTKVNLNKKSCITLSKLIAAVRPLTKRTRYSGVASGIGKASKVDKH